MLTATPDAFEENQLEKESCVKKANTIDCYAAAQDQSTELLLKSSVLNGVVVEPKTGFKFPMFLSCNRYQKGSPHSCWQELAGVGERSISILMLKTIKIYAFGFYIRPDLLKVQLGEKYSRVSPDEIKHKSSFYDDLLRFELEMTVRLMVFYKGVKMNMVRSAFETSLRNRLRKIKGSDDDDGLRSFCSYFTEGLSVPRGSVIDFHWHPGGLLRTEFEGREIGTISSLDFCRAFFDLYIGDPPVSLKAKHEIGEKLGHMLRAG